MKKNKLAFVSGMLVAVLTFNVIGSNAVMAFAETVDDNRLVYSTSNDEISPDRIAYAQVDTSCFTNSALDFVDEYVATDENGDFYITDQEPLQGLLTPEQYLLVEEQIEAVNNSVTLYAATGTENNPYELSAGVMSSVSSSSSYWFSCKVMGATDFSINMPSSYGGIYVYKKRLFGRDTLSSADHVKGTYFTSSKSSINNGENTYLINMRPNESTMLKVKVSQHRDEHTYAGGAKWVPKSDSAAPNIRTLWQQCWYIPKDKMWILLDYVSDAKFYDYQEALVAGTVTAAGIALSMYSNSAKAALATSIIAGFVGVIITPDFRQDFINKIKEVAGYSNGTFKNGVEFTEFMSSQSIIVQDVKPWDGGVMYGPSGWTGTWTRN